MQYDFIISIGRFCHTSGLLAAHNLKLFNGPWDWSGTYCEDVIYDRIERLYKGFDDYLNKADFVVWDSYKDGFFQDSFFDAPKPKSISVECQMSNQDISAPPEIWDIQYYNIHTNTYYIHDFHNIPSFDEQFDEFHKKYSRRFSRTLDLMKSKNHILLVYMNNIAEQRRNLSLDSKRVLSAMRKLRGAYPNKIIDLYMFDHSDEYHDLSFKCDILEDGIIRFTSNHYDVFSSDDTDPRHNTNGWMMPKSICYILKNISLTELTDKNITINYNIVKTSDVNGSALCCVKNYYKNRMSYYRCRIMENITWGKHRLFYKLKKKSYKRKIKYAKKLLSEQNHV